MVTYVLSQLILKVRVSLLTGEHTQRNRQPKSKFNQIVYFLTQFSHLNRQTNTHARTHAHLHTFIRTHTHTRCSLCRRSRSTANLHTPISLPISFKLELLFIEFIRIKQNFIGNFIMFSNLHSSRMIRRFSLLLFGGNFIMHSFIHSLFVFELWRSSLKSR